ncbi:MAG: nickel pincer cofactor biosynthesis protein LarC [Planctomycetota bacterium]|nr:nickel pincer cofactor biosynthesis protein LarC [Planctomycetota bacterium]
MTILYIDAFSGISGDMFLGALVDAGLPEADLRAALASLPIGGYELLVRREKRGGIEATRVEVKLAEGEQPHRHLSDIENILGAAHAAGNGERPASGAAKCGAERGGAANQTRRGDGERPPPKGSIHRTGTRRAAKCGAGGAAGAGQGSPGFVPTSSDLIPGLSRAFAVFRRLAEAEARVHGTTAEKVHFHEVGAVDAIVDIFGVCAGLEMLGVERVVASPLPMGSGSVDAAHGRLPVPVPAVVELMKGYPVRAPAPPLLRQGYGGLRRAEEEEGELTTPTGAALVVTLAEAFGPMPAMVIEKVGYGAGAREGKRVPNVLRVILGREVGPASSSATPGQADEADVVWLLEANVDDASGETLGAATQALFEAGALDVWLVPATMKKGRPGVVLACLAPEGLVAAVEEAIFRETPTFGVRRSAVERTKLAREHATVETAFGPVRVKVGRRGGRVVTASPEYEDCRRLAEERGAAFREVYAAAMEAWGRQPSRER